MKGLGNVVKSSYKVRVTLYNRTGFSKLMEMFIKDLGILELDS